MFKLPGLLLFCYVTYALVTGKVFAKSGVWGKTCTRSESPRSYWSTVVIYAALALLLVVWF